MTFSIGRWSFVAAHGLRDYFWVPRVEQRPAGSVLRIEASAAARQFGSRVRVNRQFHTARAFFAHVWLGVVMPELERVWKLSVPVDESPVWWTHPERGAVAIDSEESTHTAHRGTTTGVALTWNFTNTAGTKMVCGFVITCATSSTAALTAGPSFNGTAFSSMATVNWDTVADLGGLYYLDSPSTGSQTMSITGTGLTSFAILAGVISFTGAETGFTGTSSTGSNTTGAHATTGAITTASGNYVIGVGGQGSGNAMTADSGFANTFTITGSGSTAGDNIDCVTQLSAGSALTPGFTWSGSDHWGIVSVELKAVAAVPANPFTITNRGARPRPFAPGLAR